MPAARIDAQLPRATVRPQVKCSKRRSSGTAAAAGAGGSSSDTDDCVGARVLTSDLEWIPQVCNLFGRERGELCGVRVVRERMAVRAACARALPFERPEI